MFRLLGKRCISLVLALELAISPVAMAWAADPAQNLQPETPMGDEVQSQQSGLEPDQAQPYTEPAGEPGKVFNQVQISANVPVVQGDISYDLSDPYDPLIRQRFPLVGALRRLDVEVGQDQESWQGSIWSLVYPRLIGMADQDGPAELVGNVYYYIPAEGKNGRVPDMEFDGYYVDDRPLFQDGLEVVVDPDSAEAANIQWYSSEYDGLDTTGGAIVRLQSTYQSPALDEHNLYTILPIQGRWKASSNADVTALGLTLHDGGTRSTAVSTVYTQDPLAVDLPGTYDLDPLASGGAENIAHSEMWLWVGKDQETLDLDFQTFEPFFDFTKTPSADPNNPEQTLVTEYTTPPVQVTYAFDDGEAVPLALTRGENLACTYTPEAEYDAFNQKYVAHNGPDAPARGQWSITDIPITNQDPGAAAPERVTVTLTVTAPNETDSRTFTFHIQRRKDPTGSLNPGNTPMGMLERDTETNWGEGNKKPKEDAKETFRSYRNFQDTAARPIGAINQLGNLYLMDYRPGCWGAGKDLDLDESAVVVYQDSAFSDPGVAFYDSIGREVDLSDPLYRGTVTRSVRLAAPAGGVLSVSSYSVSGVRRWYDGTTYTLRDTDVPQVLQTGQDRVDLQGLNVLPGVYEITYTYTDPLESITDGVEGAPGYVATLTRPLVVLPIPGDVDMDGAVTLADGVALKRIVENGWNPTTTAMRLALYRVFDLNGNGILDAADYQTILDGFQPELQRNSTSDYFYLPLPVDVDERSRKTWSDVAAMSTGEEEGKLTLEFLGVEKGVWNGNTGYTANPTGPWNTKTEADGSKTPAALPNLQTGVNDSVFWMGVKLEGSPRKGQIVEDFSFSLIYDSYYVEPAQLYTAADKALFDPDEFNGWQFTMRKYNLQSTAGPGTLWSGRSSDYTMTASTPERTFQTHYSKVRSDLEENHQGTLDLKELVFSLESRGSGRYATVKDGYLLVAPFRLKVHPLDMENARLVELGAGMRDFTLVTVSSRSGGRAALLGTTGEEQASLLETAVGSGTAAFSAQAEIYGGSTQNLRSEIAYDAATGLVPIGEDNTVRTAKARGVYGVPYKDSVFAGTSGQDLSKLPPGLVFHPATGIIDGTPLLPNELGQAYDFHLNGLPYRIEILKKTMRYRPVGSQTYYGETEYRGNWASRENGAADVREFTFQYNAKDLCDADRVYATDQLGIQFKYGTEEDDPDEYRPGEELVRILGSGRTVVDARDNTTYTYSYTPPAFTAYVGDPENGVVVAQNTPVGSYTVTTEQFPWSNTYEFEEASTALLAITARPVYVDSITASAAATGRWIYNDTGAVGFTGVVLQDGPETEIRLALSPQGVGDQSPLTGAAKVPGDVLSISIDGNFLRDSEKGDTNTFFRLETLEEERLLNVNWVTLADTENSASGNYLLVYNTVQSKENDEVKGRVLLRGVNELEFVSFPNQLRETTANQYGNQISQPAALQVRVQRGDFVSDSINYQYDAPQIAGLQIHYNWVTPEEYEQGIAHPNSCVGSGFDPTLPFREQDTRPYETYRDRYLYPDMNGWRLCACVRKYSEAGGEAEFLKTYSPAIQVTKKQLTLTPQPVTRYYGENLDPGSLTYTFQVSDLAFRDMSMATYGTPEELAAILATCDGAGGFTLPTFRAEDLNGNPVTKESDVYGHYRLTLSGGQSSCYEFVYKRSDDTTSTAWGEATLTIQRRPLVVERVRGNGEGGSFADIYADTCNLLVTGPDLAADLDHVDFVLPEYDETKGCVRYHTASSGGRPYENYTGRFQDPEVKVLPGDDVRVGYQVRFLPDKDHYVWTDFAKNFFESDPFNDSPNGTLQKYVQVEQLTLQGTDSANYELVFNNYDCVNKKTPAAAAEASNQKQAPLGNGSRDVISYLVSGFGYVHLRPVENIVITDLGKMNYSYGDEYAPGQQALQGGEPLTVRVDYATRFDNDLEHNTRHETVTYRLSRIDGGVRYSTFDDRGFRIGYVYPGQTKEQAYANNQFLASGDAMLPSVHHGVALFVTGKRSEQDPLVYSKVTTDADTEADFPDRTLVVEKKLLHLTVSDAHKIYGEDNPSVYDYTFNFRDLAQRDVDAVNAAIQNGTLDEEEIENNQGTRTALRLLDAAGVRRLESGVGYRTDYQVEGDPTGATFPIHNPQSKNRYYEVSMVRAGGSSLEDVLRSALSNYTLEVETGKLYVYPRPILVTGIESDSFHPAYTIFNDTNQRSFTTGLNTDPEKGFYVTIGCAVRTDTYPVYCTDGRNRDLPITADRGLVGSDVLDFVAQVGFPLDLTISQADQILEKGQGVTAQVTRLKTEGDAAENYTLNSTGGEYPAVGAVRLRTIQAIHITGAPHKLDYTYSESLSLEGLVVRVDYVRMDGELQVESVNVDYITSEQFQAMGLYVNYWADGDAIPQTQEARKALPERYRVARTGDHLTIAPTHDSQGKPEGNTAENGYAFSANGKYLIISAFQEGENQTAVTPVVLGQRSEVTGYWEEARIPITVKPLRLTFSLAATDKTYDGDTKTAGTLTLNNIYQMNGTLNDPADPYNTAIVDTVYVPIGAGYEGFGDDHHNFHYDTLKDKVRNNQISFTTGSYTPNQEAPLLGNGTITWAEPNYIWGEHLTFSFANPNVHYVDDSGISGVGNSEKAAYWRNADGIYQTHNDVTGQWDAYRAVNAMPVEVSNLVLQGPDAANYTWGDSDAPRVERTDIRIETRAEGENGQAAVPFATIHKANRTTIQSHALGVGPTVQVDQHTNVVRLLFQEGLLSQVGTAWNNNNVDGTADDYQDELHFEYALAYQDENGLYRQWAGRTGDQGYQDTLFFGGEWVTPVLAPVAYLPILKDLPDIEKADEKTIYKGQRYQWVELDTGLSARGYRENSGVHIHASAYPGGAAYRDAYWFYDLYTADRVNLPRNTVFYPIVRLSETHNYNPSGDLTGDGERAVSAELLDAARKAVARLDDALPDEADEDLAADAAAKSQAVFTQAAAMTRAAEKDAQDKVDADHQLGESKRFPEQQPDASWPANVAVKTFAQRLDLTSNEEVRSDNREDPDNYFVETLEAVWFTDTLYYTEEKYLNAVVFNSPTRYYAYFWDRDLSAKITFNERALNFTEEIANIRVRERQPEGGTVDKYITVNQIDETVGGRVAKTYVQVSKTESNRLRKLELEPTAVFARLGDSPYQLTIRTVPAIPSNRKYAWSTSNPAVATVDSKGLVTFRGVGRCLITVTSDSGKTATAEITVSAALPVTRIQNSLFNFQFKGPWMTVDENNNFRPKEVMTRWDMVELLDRLLKPSGDWEPAGELPYGDVTGEEPGVDALRNLTGAGVVVGVPGSAFAGDQAITRAEFATMLARMLRIPVPDTTGLLHLFADSSERDTWAYSAIDAMGKTGVLNGVGGGNFAPKRVLTREEAAVVISRLLTVKLDVSKPGLKVPADMTPANWSYESVLHAINAVVFPGE